MRSRVIPLIIVFLVVSLIPVAAQTTEECEIGFVNGLLQVTGTCGPTISIGGNTHRVTMPSHLLQPPEFTGTIDPTPDRNLRAKRNSKQKDKRQRRQVQKQLRRDREDLKRTNAQATSTAIAGATSTAIARATSTASAQLTATARARTNPREDQDDRSGQANAQAAFGAMAPTPTPHDKRDKRKRERARDERGRDERADAVRAQSAPHASYPTPIPQLSPEPGFTNG